MITGTVPHDPANMSGWTDGVSHMDGMTAIGGITSGNSAMTIGPYSFGPKNYKATWKDNLFVHEYGHYIQHLYWGHFYLPVIAVPSLLSTQHVGSGSHKDRWFEIDASNKGARHFNKYYGSESAAYEEEYVGTNGRVDKSKYFSWETFVGGWQYYKSPRLYDKPDLPQDCIFHTDFNGVQFFDFSIPLISSMFIQ